MLAAIEKISDVDEARVDWSGKKMLVKGGETSLVVAKLREKGYAGSPMSPQQTEDCVASLDRGDPWMTSAETMKMSRREAEVLAQTWSKGLAAKHGIDEAWFRDVLKEELEVSFKEAHAAGADPDLHELFKGLLARLSKRLDGRLPPEKRDAVLEDLKKRGER